MAYNFNTAELRKTLAKVFSATTGHNHDGSNSKAITFPASYTLASGKIIVGSAGNLGAPVSMSGDITITNAGATAIGAGKVLPSMLSAAAKTQVLSYQVEDLAADGDISARALFVAPAGVDVTITKASIISQGTPAGIDDANTCVVELLNGADSIVAKTYNTATAFPADGVQGDLGALAAFKALAAGSVLKLSVTNGAAANPPRFMVQIEYTIAAAA